MIFFQSSKRAELIQLAYVAGAVLMLLAVALGAFGTHALDSSLRVSGNLAVYKTANQYHFLHALALLIIAGMGDRIQERMMMVIVYSMLVGVVLFSGSLYLLAVLDFSPLGIITPIGGVSMLLAWFCLVFSQIRNRI